MEEEATVGLTDERRRRSWGHRGGGRSSGERKASRTLGVLGRVPVLRCGDPARRASASPVCWQRGSGGWECQAPAGLAPLGLEPGQRSPAACPGVWKPTPSAASQARAPVPGERARCSLVLGKPRSKDGPKVPTHPNTHLRRKPSPTLPSVLGTEPRGARLGQPRLFVILHSLCGRRPPTGQLWTVFILPPWVLPRPVPASLRLCGPSEP